MRSRPLGEPRQCAACGATFVPLRYKVKRRYCSRQCFLATLRTAEHQRAAAKAAGRVKAALRGTGTKAPYVKRGGRHEHRVVIEERLGRPLRSDEIVHHDDENGKNNESTNLIVVTRSEHAKIHFSGRKHSAAHVAKRVESMRRTIAEKKRAAQCPN